MKYRLGLICFSFSTLLISGCASRHAGPVYHAGDENPPPFLTGPVGPVLTNIGGFSAHVAGLLSSPVGSTKLINGTLLGRDGKLIYQPTLLIKGKRAKAEGGLFFIWDDNQHSGYVISEALQGYAPISSDASPTNAFSPAPAAPAATEVINGYPCRRAEVMVPLNDGNNARVVEWQANSLHHFPVRIESVQGTNTITLNFTDIRLQYPAQELFRPPDGFTMYPDGVRLMNELIIRDASLTKKTQTGEFSDEPQDTRNPNWHPSNPMPQ